jgi:hypothetical protein
MCSPCFRPISPLFCASLLLILPIPSNSQESAEPQFVCLSYLNGEQFVQRRRSL